jgi:hypothetical protein
MKKNKLIKKYVLPEELVPELIVDFFVDALWGLTKQTTKDIVNKSFITDKRWTIIKERAHVVSWAEQGTILVVKTIDFN